MYSDGGRQSGVLAGAGRGYGLDSVRGAVSGRPSGALAGIRLLWRGDRRGAADLGARPQPPVTRFYQFCKYNLTLYFALSTSFSTTLRCSDP